MHSQDPTVHRVRTDSSKKLTLISMTVESDVHKPREWFGALHPPVQ